MRRLPAALVLAGLFARPAPAGHARPDAADTQVYRLELQAAVMDEFLPAPTRPHVLFRLDARAAAPKSRIMFLQPLPAGRHRLRLEVTGAGRERTFVIAVPVRRGRSTFDVSIAGTGRYDFGFWAGDPKAPTKEYRFSLVGPVAAKTFEVDLP